MHFFAKISPAMPRLVVTPQRTQRTLRFSLLALSLMTTLGQSLAPARAAEPRIALAGNVLPAPALRQAHLLGRLDSTTTLHAGLILPLRNQSQLSDLLRRQYTPGDALYHQFLTPGDFTARFGPTVEDYAAVTAYARAQGLTITQTSPGRTLLNVSGPAARMEQAFGVQLSRYRLPSGRLVFANSAAPLLPISIAARLAGIAGLNNVGQMRPYVRQMKSQHLIGSDQSSLRSNAPVPITGGDGGIGSGPLGGLAPNDVKYAYSLNTITPLYGSSVPVPTAALDGTGQNIGLFELDGFAAADIAKYAGQFTLPTALTGTTSAVQTVLLGGFSGMPISVEGQSEVTLDIDMVLALAPAAAGVYVYEDDGTVDTSAPITIFTAMANQLSPGSAKPLLQVISCSWGIAEQLEDPAILQGENTLFQQMAAQGQSLFCSSGDNGAYDLYDPTLPTLTSPAVDNPSSQPFATGVGGTTLGYVKPGTTAGTGVATPGAYVGETAWSAGTASVNPEGSGGGASSIWPKPDYQLGVGASPTRRDVPDVSLNADPNTGYSIFVGGTAEVVGGTSAAAPLWAAYTALVNQQRTVNGLGPIGFINPLIYPIGAGSSYNADFHDIISGSNLFYQAGAGYDDATGYGSFIGAPLLAALSLNANQGTGTATLTGIVTDSSVPAAPVVGATVTVASAGKTVATTTTDSSGAYTLTVPSGLLLNVKVGTGAITAPTVGTATPPATESLTGVTVTLPVLTVDQSLTENFTLASAHVYAAGLQMFSAPFDYTGLGDFAALFGLTAAQANVSPRLIQFSPLLNGYVFYPNSPADTLRLGQGYWVRFPAAAFVQVAGVPASTAQAFSIPLQPGWNQIGDPFTTSSPLSSITVVPSSGTSGPLASSTAVQPTLYRYDTGSSAYVALKPAADSLDPYNGYWVFAFQKSTLSVPPPGPPSSPLAGQ